ncbi:TPA: hypothetical protein ACW72U_002051 [Enterobacter ludwigii]|uniref:hypothetical protein n=1 Tax=Enterobacter TaxID=547 RepID=UPI0015F5FBA9|nr:MULTISPECIES: hypothetical protein [Enterobacter]MBA7772605.1 hypothetical protein [Enterobacter sp. RHBSTW-00974]MBA7777694.1 hypothetical protein [Enterobacter sp. RHBSTW-00318]MBA7830753.1 hypothetical protein [Enterobacter sp. RHBSTW-00340]MBA8040057.1 hypothetical protein [Enterobacter sp. RHBSTW-00131]MBG0583913.1 hypothetical protein [Enterobacter ludwigii]
MVRRVLLMGFILAAFSANAGRITMSNPEQSTTANGQTLCVYSSSIYTFTFTTRSKKCPYSKTFDTDDSK